MIAGADLWHRLTGDADFYQDLINAIGSVAIESDYSKDFEKIIEELAATDEVQKLASKGKV